MSFKQLISDSRNGIRRDISSRREKIKVTIAQFNELSSKYFSQIAEGQNLKIKYESDDKDLLIFILRWYYNLWIDINRELITVFNSFPDAFLVVKEVNKTNHPFTPKIFAKGTILYSTGSSYGTCNWLKGVPLWDNLEDEILPGIKPNCQINYEFIKVFETI